VQDGGATSNILEKKLVILQTDLQCAECNTMAAIKHRDLSVTFCGCVVDTNGCKNGLKYLNVPLAL
jgi:hypothetical protein